jgi:hypothetical protein
MYYLAVRQFMKTLKSLDHILDKAVKHAQGKNFDANNFVGERLVPDMLPFAAQIRIACDNAKSTAALLAGKEPPKHEDNEKTMEELRARVGKCLAYLETFAAADYAKTDAKTVIRLPHPKGKALHAEEYLFGRQIPNFFFHVTTAYNILRQGGVDLGKTDYLGALNLIDA